MNGINGSCAPYVTVGRADEGFPVGDHAPGRDADGHHVLLRAATDGVVSDHLPNVLHQPIVRAPGENPGSWKHTQSSGGAKHPPSHSIKGITQTPFVTLGLYSSTEDKGDATQLTSCYHRHPLTPSDVTSKPLLSHVP